MTASRKNSGELPPVQLMPANFAVAHLLFGNIFGNSKPPAPSEAKATEMTAKPTQPSVLTKRSPRLRKP